MQTREFPVVLEWDSAEQVWTTYVPGLDIADWGETREEALEHTRAAISLYLESAAELGLPVPDHERTELVRVSVSVV